MSNVVRVRDQLGIDEAVLQKIVARRTIKVLPQTLFNLGVYALLSFIGIWFGIWWVWIAIWLVQGFILSCALGASHDCAHSTFATTPFANHFAGVLWSSTVLFNYSLYKHFHLEHHRFTMITGDTEPLGVFKGFWDYVRSLPTTAFFVSFWIMSVQSTFGRFPHFIKSPQARSEVQVDNVALLLWVVTISTLTILWPVKMLVLYWGPIFFYFPMVFLTSLPEHYGCDEGPDALSNTRSLTSNFLFRYMFWNGNFHAEHHIYPTVPSYNLPKLHELIGSKFKYKERSYVSFHLKLMISLLRQSKPKGQMLLSALKRIEYKTYKAPESRDSTAANN